MADFAPALVKTLEHEGGFVHVAATGEVASRGITHWTLRSLGLMPGVPINTPRTIPASPAEIERVRSMSPEETAIIYRTEYWAKIRGGEIRDQGVADKVFDLAVNAGVAAAVRILQRAVNQMLWPEREVTIDGVIGAKTLAAANGLIGEALLDEIRREAERFYRLLAFDKPVLAVNLDSWLKRLAA